MKNLFVNSNTMKYRLYSLSFLILLNFILPVNSHSQTLRINELMALNQSVLTDEDGNSSDWIEIYNTSSDPVNLLGYSLSDDSSDLELWTFPEYVLNGNSYLIVFASSVNRTDPNEELHTNFRLNGDGEFLALSDAEGQIISQFNPEYPPQFPDVSYGYHDGDFVFFTTPTPGTANQYTEHQLLSPPEFSVDHGLFEFPFNVELTSDLPGATIYYTTDASDPNAANSEEYTSPVQISTTTVLRAIVVDGQGATSPSVTCTYIFLEDVIQQPNDPPGYPEEWGPYTSMQGNAPADYEMDTEITQDPDYRDLMKESLLSIPTISIVSDIDNFFSHEEDSERGGIYIYTGPPISSSVDGYGIGWERPGSFEFFNAEGHEGFQENCGIKLQGGHSRRPEKSPKHSFRLVFRSEYGPTELEYPLFGEDGAQSFNTVTLRAGFCNKWYHHSSDQRDRTQYLRDRWCKDTQLEMGHLSGRGFFAHLYVNGIYWGLYNPTERMDNDFAASYYGGLDDDYDVIKDYTEVVDGEIDAWDAMMNIARSGLGNTTNYQRIQGNNPDGTRNFEYEPYLNVVNFIDYMLINFYGANTDWDHHNWAAIRSRENPDKGFTFFSWDAEHVLKDVDGYSLHEDNNNCPSELFNRLRSNADFLQLFADRVQLHCYNGGVLTPESASARYMERVDEIEMAVIAESARWGDYRRDVHQNQPQGPFDLYTKNDHWLPALAFLTDEYFPNRTDVFIGQLRQANLFPQTDAPVFYINGTRKTNTEIAAGDIFTMTASGGTIYYTTDGTDPMQTESSQSGGNTVLLSETSDKRVIIPRSDIGTAWRTEYNFNDSDWQLCSGSPGGVGYEKRNGYESLISLDVGDEMHDDGGNPQATCYVRIKFNVSKNDLSTLKSLQLGVSYDDGFIAYLNGTLVAQENAPVSPSWNSGSSSGHESNDFEELDISGHLGSLVEGNNLLSIHAMNTSTNSSDFLINVNLEGSEDAAGSGSVASGALVYSDPVALNENTYIKARVLSGNNWSALTTSMYSMPSDEPNIKMTEIHYHPLAEDNVDDREFEFVELKNTGDTPVDMAGFQFVDGIAYTFSQKSVLNAGDFIVLVSNQQHFGERYKQEGFARYEGNLNNGGERLVLVNAKGDTIINIPYNDQGGWPAEADGQGYSLVSTDYNPEGDQDDPSDWRISHNVHGSPGEDDTEDASIDESIAQSMSDFQLMQNYPNPFNPITQITYTISEASFVQLTVFDILGREVRQLVAQYQSPNNYTVQFDAGSLSTGIYFYELKAGEYFYDRKKMLLMK